VSADAIGWDWPPAESFVPCGRVRSSAILTFLVLALCISGVLFGTLFGLVLTGVIRATSVL
jgi:hypothetical protein